MKQKTFRFSHLFLGIVLTVMYLPIILLVVYSFNESKISSVWGGFSFKWYQQLFQDEQMFEALWNSIVLGVLSSVCAAVLGTLGAFGMSKIKCRANHVMEYLVTLPIMIPEIILAMVFLAFFSLLGLPFGMTTLVLGHTAFCVPYVFMLVKASLVGMDTSLAEAARDLGATEVQVFRDITLPLVAPAIASGMVLSFAMSFDDVIISLFVTGVNVNTLPIRVYTQIKTGVTPEINALCTLMLAATLVLVAISAVIGRKKPNINEQQKENI